MIDDDYCFAFRASNLDYVVRTIESRRVTEARLFLENMLRASISGHANEPKLANLISNGMEARKRSCWGV